MEVKNNKKIIEPEEFLNKFLKWFNNNRRLAFLSAFILGIIAHIQMITDYLMSQDGLWNSMKFAKPGDWEVRLGRWGIYLIENLTNFVAIPAISTVFSILLISISSVLICDIFNFKKKVSILFTSAFLILAPTFVATMTYVYTAPAYMASVLFSILAAYFLLRIKDKKIKYIVSPIFIMFSASIYQSAIGIIIGLIIMRIIINLLNNEYNIKDSLKEILDLIISLIIGFVLYYIVTIIILKIIGMEFSDRSTSISAIFASLFVGVKNCYKDFLAYFLRDRIVINNSYKRDILFLILFFFTFILAVYKLMKLNTNGNKVLKIFFICLLTIILPICLNIVNLIVPENVLYVLTSYQMVMIIPFIISIYESINEDNYFTIISKWGIIIISFVILITYLLATFTSYTALKLTYNQAIETTERIIDRIETTEGYYDGMPVLIGGMIGNDNYPRTSSLYYFTIGDIVNNPVFHISYNGQIGTWKAFIKIFFGLDINLCDEATYARIVQYNTFKELGTFPDQDSVMIIDGVIVVKLRDEVSLP